MIGHGRWRRDVVDDALGLLGPDRSEALRRHVEGCGACREERDRLQRTLRLAAADPAPRSEPPIDLPAFLTRVEAEIDRRLAGPVRVRRRSALWVPAAMAAALLLFVARPRSTPPPPDTGVSAVALRQMERTVNREQTARYLQEAQGVLLSVATALPRCERVSGRREVGPEAEKSRELLARRRLLVDAEAEHLAMARPVIEDVDRALGEVASLDRCAAAAELRALARRIADERLLMKIDLMARELQG